MTDTTRRSSALRGADDGDGPRPEAGPWDQRHVRVTFWLERSLREEVRMAAQSRAVSITQFVAQALRRAVAETK